jgi:hypothetical protein
VAAQIGRGEGHDHLVSGPGPDLVIASGAPVRLRGLVRLHVPHFDLGGRGIARRRHVSGA